MIVYQGDGFEGWPKSLCVLVRSDDPTVVSVDRRLEDGEGPPGREPSWESWSLTVDQADELAGLLRIATDRARRTSEALNAIAATPDADGEQEGID